MKREDPGELLLTHFVGINHLWSGTMV